MTSSPLSHQDVLCISISINVCFFLQMLMARMVRCLAPYLSHRSSMGRTLCNIHQRWPDHFERIMTEQIALFVLLVLILINLGFVSSSILPFREHANNEYHQLTRVILCASTARFIVIAMNILLVNDITPCIGGNDQSAGRKCNTLGHTRNGGCDFTYCLFSIVSNMIGLRYRQNLLVVGTSSFMELNTTCLVICRLIKLANRQHGSQSYFKTSILCFAVCLFSRVLLPVLFLCLALGQESPLVMDTIPLIWFFISGAVYFLYHIVLLFQSMRRISKALVLRSEPGPQTCHQTSNDTTFSIHTNSNRLINDIYTDDNEDCEKDGFDKNFKKLKDLNYGFLPCYDNRNMCGYISGHEEEKINFLQKKNTSKHELINKYISTGCVPKQKNIYPDADVDDSLEMRTWREECENRDRKISDSPFEGHVFINKDKMGSTEGDLNRSHHYDEDSHRVIARDVGGHKLSLKMENESVEMEKECKYNLDSGECNYNLDSRECQHNLDSRECNYNLDSGECNYNLDSRECKHNLDSRECKYNLDSRECKYNLDSRECKHNLDSRECKYNLDSRECKYNLDSRECKYNLDGRECKDNLDSRECKHNLDRRECKYNLDSRECKHNLDSRECKDNLDSRECKDNLDRRECKHILDSRECKHNLDRRECDGVGQTKGRPQRSVTLPMVGCGQRFSATDGDTVHEKEHDDVVAASSVFKCGESDDVIPHGFNPRSFNKLFNDTFNHNEFDNHQMSEYSID